MAATLAARLHAHFAPLHDRPTPDADLLARFALHGDAGAFAALVARHGGMVAAVCRKRLGHAHDAEDAAQAVFLALARKASRVHGTAPVAAWLYGASVKACREVARRNRRKPWVPLTADVPGDTAVSADPDAVAALLDEVAHLSDACRAAVVLCELEGCPRSLAASRLGIAEGTLSSRLAAARRRLAERLARRGFAPSALAALTGLAVGGPSLAFDLPSVTPLVQRITEAIVSTIIAWKLKLCAALGVTGASLGLMFAGGDEPKPVAPAKPEVVAKAAEPSFVFATVTPRVERVEPRRVVPATAAVWALSGDGVLGTSQSRDLLDVGSEVKRVTVGDSKGIALVDAADITTADVSPDGRSLVQGLLGQVVRPGRELVFRQGVPMIGQSNSTLIRSQSYLVDNVGRALRLTDWADGYPAYVWSPDGLFVYSTRTDEAGALQATPPFVSFSPTHVTTRFEVATGKKQRLLLPSSAWPIAVSPNGRSLLVVTNPRADEYVLALATLSEDPEQAATLRPLGEPVTVGGYTREAAFSPDGKRAVVTRWVSVPYPKHLLPPASPHDGLVTYPSRQFQLVDLAAGTVTPLATQPTAVPDYGHGVRWSPDGGRVAFTDAKGWSHGSDGMQVVEPCVVTCDPDGKNPAKVAVPTPKPASFQFTGYGPQFVAWK